MSDKEKNRIIELPRITCDSIDELANLYVDGELESAIKIRFEQHIKQCNKCRDSVIELEHLVFAAFTLEDTPMPSDVRSRLRDTLQKRVGYNAHRQIPQLRLIN